MKKRRIITNLFTLFVSFVMMIVFSCENIGAVYKKSENKVLEYFASKKDNIVKVSIQYQYGMKDLKIYICDNTGVACTTDDGFITKYVDSSLDSSQGDTHMVINRTSDDVTVYTQEYETPFKGLTLNSYSEKIVDGEPDNKYAIVIEATFCEVRTNDLSSCSSWSSDSTLLVNEMFTLQTGLTNSSQVNEAVSNILYITNTYVIPVLWVGLALLLIIKGILLGIDIVKSADDSDVRKRKIGALSWLAIGVLVGYAVTILASYVLSLSGYGGLLK